MGACHIAPTRPFLICNALACRTEVWYRLAISRTNNVIERLNRQIRRRARVVGTFQTAILPSDRPVPGYAMWLELSGATRGMENTQLSIPLLKKLEIFSSLSGFYSFAFEFVFVEPSDQPKARARFFTGCHNPVTLYASFPLRKANDRRFSDRALPAKAGIPFISLSCIFPAFVLYFL